MEEDLEGSGAITVGARDTAGSVGVESVEGDESVESVGKPVEGSALEGTGSVEGADCEGSGIVASGQAVVDGVVLDTDPSATKAAGANKVVLEAGSACTDTLTTSVGTVGLMEGQSSSLFTPVELTGHDGAPADSESVRVSPAGGATNTESEHPIIPSVHEGTLVGDLLGFAVVNPSGSSSGVQTQSTNTQGLNLDILSDLPDPAEQIQSFSSHGDSALGDLLGMDELNVGVKSNPVPQEVDQHAGVSPPDVPQSIHDCDSLQSNTSNPLKCDDVFLPASHHESLETANYPDRTASPIEREVQPDSVGVGEDLQGLETTLQPLQDERPNSIQSSFLPVFDESKQLELDHPMSLVVESSMAETSQSSEAVDMPRDKLQRIHAEADGSLMVLEGRIIMEDSSTIDGGSLIDAQPAAAGSGKPHDTVDINAAITAAEVRQPSSDSVSLSKPLPTQTDGVRQTSNSPLDTNSNLHTSALINQNDNHISDVSGGSPGTGGSEQVGADVPAAGVAGDVGVPGGGFGFSDDPFASGNAGGSAADPAVLGGSPGTGGSEQVSADVPAAGVAGEVCFFHGDADSTRMSKSRLLDEAIVNDVEKAAKDVEGQMGTEDDDFVLQVKDVSSGSVVSSGELLAELSLTSLPGRENAIEASIVSSAQAVQEVLRGRKLAKYTRGGRGRAHSKVVRVLPPASRGEPPRIVWDGKEKAIASVSAGLPFGVSLGGSDTEGTAFSVQVLPVQGKTLTKSKMLDEAQREIIFSATSKAVRETWCAGITYLLEQSRTVVGQ